MAVRATLEQSIPLQVQTQKNVLIMRLKDHRDKIDNLITAMENSQTHEEMLSNMQEAKKTMMR